MPVFDLRCLACGLTQERYLPHASSANPGCEDASCGGTTVRLISPFAVVFTGPLAARYNDPKSENAHQEGHWAYAMRTPDGKPKPVWIDSFDKQREFCRQEGVVNPKDLPSSAEAVSDKRLSGRGMPGQWT